MENQLQEKVKQSINILRDKQARIYFLVQDTKGNAKASVRLIYQMAKTLKDNGFNPIILHEKADYAGVVAWLNEEYMSIPHRAIEGQNLEISPEEAAEYTQTFEGAAQSACWFWETNKLNQWADTGDILTMTKRINGGTIGLEDRIKHYKHALHILGVH